MDQFLATGESVCFNDELYLLADPFLIIICQ